MFQALLNRVRSDVVRTYPNMTTQNLLNSGNVVEGIREAKFECGAHPELRPQPAFQSRDGLAPWNIIVCFSLSRTEVHR